MQYFFGVYRASCRSTAPAAARSCGSSRADWNNLSHLILPAVTLGIIEVAYISYMQRAAMLEVIRSDYVRTARAKGLPERSVILKHGLKNALIPVMTIAGIDLGALLGGAILTETVFSRSGVGLMVYNAINSRDLPVVVGGVLFATLVYVIANLVVDVAYAYVDPRIRYEIAGDDRHRIRRRLSADASRARLDSAPLPVGSENEPLSAKPLGLWADTWRRLRRNKLALVGLGIIVVFLVVGVAEILAGVTGIHGGYLAPYNPNAVNYSYRQGGRRRWLIPSAPTTSVATCSRACSWRRASRCWSA